MFTFAVYAKKLNAILRSQSSSSPNGEWAIISQTKTNKRKFFFSIRWKILIAFLLILGVSFYVIATSLAKLVGDYLFKTRINQETATVQVLAERFAPAFAKGDTEQLYLEARRAAGARSAIILLDMDGKVQVDTQSKYNGLRFRHAEVVSALRGMAIDHGFHLVTMQNEAEQSAIFDFLRPKQTEKSWVGYFATPMMYGSSQIGVLLYVVNVEDMVTTLREMQDQMLLNFFVVAMAVFALSLLFSTIITKPIATLIEGIKRMARGDLSGRVKVSGTDEMARLAETFNQMSEKLENLDNSRNEFVSNASHELRTPLATMKIMLEAVLYKDDVDPAIRSEFMMDINKELDRLSTIVTDLLTLVQSDSHEYKVYKKSMILKDVVEEVVRRLRPMAKEKSQTIQLKATAECAMQGDPNKLHQAVYNLVDNAIKYSAWNDKILVTLKQEGKMAVIEVTDSGPGIPKKDQPHVFDRFYRVDKARSRATGGNGLGLSIVHQAVIQHDGSVSVTSEEGKGATFRIELPI